jgi:hypothetical protein
MHELRTRRMAHQVLVDAHVQVNPRISVSEGHRVAESARRRVLASHPEVLDVLVHVDAENDLMGNAAAELARPRYLARPPAAAARRAARIRAHHLHYLGNRVEAEVFLPPGLPMPARHAARRLTDGLATDPWFSAIRLNRRLHQIVHQDSAFVSGNALIWCNKVPSGEPKRLVAQSLPRAARLARYLLIECSHRFSFGTDFPALAIHSGEQLMTPQDVIKMVEEKEVKFVDFRFTDTRGKEQHVGVPVSAFSMDKFEDGHAFDGSSIAGWKGIQASDMH